MGFQHTLLKGISLGFLFLIMFIGCSRTVAGIQWCNGGTICPDEEIVSEKIIEKAGLTQKTVKVYIDDSIDQSKNKRFAEIFAEAINEYKDYNEVSLLGDSYLGINEKLYALNSFDSSQPFSNSMLFVQPENKPNLESMYSAKIKMYFFAPTGNHRFTNQYYNKSGLLTSTNYYPAKKYSAYITSDNGIDIKGHQNEVEGIAFYLFLVDSTIKFGFDNKFMEHINKVFEKNNAFYLNPIKYFGGTSFEYDFAKLHQENKLILKPTMDNSSFKKMLSSKIALKYTVVDSREKADIILATNLLMYASKATTKKDDIVSIQTNDEIQASSIFKDSSNSTGVALNNLSNSISSTSSAKGAMSVVSGAELALSMAGPNETQNRIIIQRIYFLKPTGELVSKKSYVASEFFTEQSLIKSPLQLPANILNEKIAKQIVFDLQ